MSDLDTLRETEDSFLAQTPTGKDADRIAPETVSSAKAAFPSSSLWTERLHATPEKLRDSGPTTMASKSPLVSSRDLIRAAFASRIVQRDASGENTPKLFFLSSPDDNIVRSVFSTPHKSSQGEKEEPPVNMCNDFLRSAFSSKVVRPTHTERSYDDYILNNISEGMEDSSAFSEGVGPAPHQKVTESVGYDSETLQSSVQTDNSAEDLLVSDEHLSQLNQCVEAIMALTSDGANRSADIQPIVDDALNAGVPKYLLHKIIHGLIDDNEYAQNPRDLDQMVTPSHRTLSNASPLPSLVHLAYASSVKAYIDDVRKNKVSLHYEAQENDICQVTGESEVKDHPPMDEDENYDESSSMSRSNVDDLWIDDAVISLQSELLQRAIDLMQNGFTQSDVDVLLSEARDHNFDATLFQQLFDVFLLHDKHEEFLDALSSVFMERAISMAQQGQQSDQSMSFLLAAALICGVSTDAIKRRYLKEKKRCLEKRMLDGNMPNNSMQTSSLLHEAFVMDSSEPESAISFKQNHESQSQDPKNLSTAYDSVSRDDEDTPRKHHVAEFHNTENGDAEFYLMEDDDVEVAFFDESAEVRMLDEAREDGKGKVQGKSVMSQIQEMGVSGDGIYHHIARLDQGKSDEGTGLRSLAPLGIMTVHAVSASIALKSRHQLKILAAEGNKRSTGDELDSLNKGFEGFDLTSLKDATRIAKVSKLSEDRTWDAPDAHKFLVEKRMLEPRTWLGT